VAGACVADGLDEAATEVAYSVGAGGGGGDAGGGASLLGGRGEGVEVCFTHLSEC
jgi:hypothetical protein